MILQEVDGILVPGGFGEREQRVRFVPLNMLVKIKFFGICLGMQLALIEFCRNVLGIKDATSEEFESKGLCNSLY